MEAKDPLLEGKLVRDFVRGKVLVDVTKPLPTGCWIPRVDLPKLWVVYKYERLQNLCLNYGVLGHEQKHCKAPKAMATFNTSFPKYAYCVPAARPLANMLEEHKMRKAKHTNPQSAASNNVPTGTQKDQDLQSFYNEVIGNVYAWKGSKEDFRKFINVCFPTEPPRVATVNKEANEENPNTSPYTVPTV